MKPQWPAINNPNGRQPQRPPFTGGLLLPATAGVKIDQHQASQQNNAHLGPRPPALHRRFASGQAAAISSDATPFHDDSDHPPFENGALIQGGFGLTEGRDDFKFFMAGVHAGKVLVTTHGHSAFRSNFEYAVEVFPFWQSYTPKFQRPFCTNPPGTPEQCTPFYTVGGTFTGASITPVIFRWNIAGTRRFSFWGQAAGGVL